MSHTVSGAKRDPVVVLHDDIVASPGGVKAAAERVGRSPGVLHNKFSEAMPHYEVTVREALALARGVPTTNFVEAVCEHFDGVFFPLPAGSPDEDDVLQAYLEIVQQMGDLSREFTEARADGVIEPAEFAALKLRGHRTVAAVMKLLGELQTMVRELPKPDLRRAS